MSLALQVLATGLAAGGVYGLVAVGHTLVYRLTGIVHLALGDLIGLAVFATLLVAAGTAPLSRGQAPTGRFLLALLVGLLVCIGAGAVCYVLAEPYISGRSTLGWVAATLAVAFAVRASVSAVFPRPSYVFPDLLPFDRVGSGGRVDLGGASIHVRTLFVIGVAFALAAGGAWFLERTRQGRALRAIADDAEAAVVVGVPRDRLVGLTFCAVGAAAALAAIAAAPNTPVDVDTGTLLGVKGLVAALLVRFASTWRVFAAGLGVGVAESVIANQEIHGVGLGSAWSEVVPLGGALLLLALRPLRDAVEEVE